MGKKDIIEKIKGGLIVSCQALEDEPLHSSFIMKKMAKAAMLGGAVAIRANGYEDIKEIKSEVNLPIIGLIKKKYDGFLPYITPTIQEVDKIVQAGADIVAIDATKLEKPGQLTTGELFQQIKIKYPNILMMADISTYEEGIKAYKLGFDLVSTTLSGYTDYSTKINGPDFDLIERLSKDIDIPLIGEGKIQTPEQTVMALKFGAYAIVVGGAITRPQEITKRFVSYIKRSDALL
ncbi:putative N-acetylmannosamine-6-phosphate 2-epimerase [Vallitalea longa]|uniref:Putative N-acetylmannosamine-6-phosphate 2-epimerase n=1 Tax=Vallitalea longa TaxID=2936439 RepID=A0A9W5Y9T2_9FIRM|nr:N-acetylmannosamine-6-phosphate 2-epimerase [Vallitalea longa]GKX29950.1 putative N-acetylmannosamine-6-phosphate 2-epimerase [Vallitalea longa]